MSKGNDLGGALPVPYSIIPRDQGSSRCRDGEGDEEDSPPVELRGDFNEMGRR